MSRRLVRFIAVLSILGLLAGACSNDNGSTKTNNGKGNSNGSTNTPGTGGLFPQELVNKAVHDGTPKRGGTLTFGVESDFLAFSPNQNVIQPSDVQMASAAFDSLITYGDEGKFKGIPVTDNTDHHYNQLADKLVPSKDLKTWTLTLRKGLKFANGHTLDAAAVKDHTDWIKASGSSCSCQADAANIASVDAPNATTVVYHLTTPLVDFPGKLNLGGLGWIIDPAARNAAKDPSNPDIQHLVGAGPFKYLSNSSTGYELVKNPYYYGKDPVNGEKLPYLDKIIFKSLDDSTTRLQAVQSNGVQLMQTADTSNLANAKKDATLRVQPSEGSSSTILVLNLTHPPFGVKPKSDAQATAIASLDDPDALAARQAFNYAINRNEINQKYYKGARVPAYGFIPESSRWYEPKGQLPRFDSAKAKKIIADLKKKGMSTTVNAMCINTPESTGIFAILKEQAEAVGITPTLKQVEQAILVQNLLGGGDSTWDVACFRSPQIADPDGIYGALKTGGASNLVKYSRPNVDKWLDEGRSNPDDAVRKKVYGEIQVQVAKDVVYIPLLFDYFGNVFRKNVSGLSTPSPNSLGIIEPGQLYYTK